VARRHHPQAERVERSASSAVVDLHVPQAALPRPAAGRCRLRPPRLFHQQGQGGGLLPPRCKGLAHRTGAWDEGDSTKPLFQPSAAGAATLRLPVRAHPTHSVQAPRQTLCNRPGRCDPITAVAIPPPKAQGDAASPAHSEPEAPLVEVVVAILALSLRRVRGLRTLRLVRIRPVEPHGRGVLRQPGRRDGLDREGLEGDHAQHLVELGGTPRIAEVAPAGVMQRDPCKPRL